MTDQHTSAATALQHLQAFRQSWTAEDVVDEASGLTAADLDTIIESLGGSSGAVAPPPALPVHINDQEADA